MEEEEECEEGRLFLSSVSIDYGLVGGRFERMMMEFLVGIKGEYERENENYGFMMTAGLKDYSSILNIVKYAFSSTLMKNIDSVRKISIILTIVQIIFILLSFLFLTLPLMIQLSSLSHITHALHTIIPVSLTSHLELIQEMKTDIDVLDNGRTTLLDSLFDLYDSIISFSPLSTTRLYATSLLSATKTYFNDEDELISATEFNPVLKARHLLDHFLLLQRLERLVENASSEDDAQRFGSLRVIGTVFHDHFSSWDIHFGVVLKELLEEIADTKEEV
jgi:hemerythrin